MYPSNKGLPRKLGDELVLRRASAEDADRLGEFNSRVHSDAGWEKPFEPIKSWTRDLLLKDHPTFKPEYFTLVEDTSSGKIVSTLNMIPQTWTYAGIPLPVGRPELVATHPDYRNRGLVREQFDEIHHWGAARGELMQVITGIPYYYRQFGYEMALDLGGGRTGYLAHVPKLKEDEKEIYRIRPAEEKDLPFIAQLYELGSQRSLLSCQRDLRTWQYELSGHSKTSINRRVLQIIERAENSAPVGYLAHPHLLWGAVLVATQYEIKPGESWLEITPAVIRYLETTGAAYSQNADERFQAFSFGLGRDHPVYDAALSRLRYQYQPYAYYVRVPDLPALLRRIQPELEKRLADSNEPKYNGKLELSFYRQGLQFVFEEGKITGIEPWKPTPRGESGDAVFPGLTFLQLVFGYRTLDELEDIYPDCTHRNDGARVVLNALFPKQSSDVWSLS